MKFKGVGVVWNKYKNKPLVNFKDIDVYETSDKNEIEILSNSLHIEIIDSEIIEISDEPKPMTKNEVMESLDASGIDYNPRDKKEVLYALLEV